jgi:hypothetical protein
MRGHWWAAAVLAVGVLTGVAATAGPAAADTTNEWQLSALLKIPPDGDFFQVAATGTDNAWAVGEEFYSPSKFGPVAAQWNGGKWVARTVPGSAGYALEEVSASSARNVWVLGASAAGALRLFRYDGAHWHTMSLPPSTGITATQFWNSHYYGDLVALGPRDVWIGTDGLCPTTCSTNIWHWNGSRWTNDKIGMAVFDLAGVSDNDMWVSGYTSRDLGGTRGPGPLVAYKWNGKKWIRVGLPTVIGEDIPGIAMDAANDLWLTTVNKSRTASEVLHWNGHHWQVITGPVSWTPTADGHGGLWLGMGSHWTGGQWVDTGNFGQSFNGLGAVGGSGPVAAIPGTAGSYWSAGDLEPHQRGPYYPTIILYGPKP